MGNPRFKAGDRFPTKRQLYDSDDDEQYDHVEPAINDNGKFWLVDCWLVTEDGKVHPGYNVSPVPVRVEDIDS